MLDSLHNFVSQSNWIGPFLVRVSICALMILIARRLLAYRWGAQIRRLLWTILIIRCLVPWTQPIHYHPAGLLEFNRNQEASITSSISSEQIDTYAYIEPDQTVQPLIVSQGNGPVLNYSFEYGVSVMVGLWILGVLAVLIITQYHNRRMISRAIADTVPVPAWIREIFRSCRGQLKIRTCPVLIISPHIASPCLIGAIRPRILLPSKLLEDTTECEMRHILLHECIHLQQRDVWYAWLWTVTLALHWFNPLLWWAGRRLSQDCEAACDERVLAALDPDKRISYGQSLLALAQRLRPTEKTQPGFICIVERVTKIERRLTMIKNYHKCHVPIMGKIVLILFAVLALTSYAGQHSKAPINPEKAEMMGRVEDYFLHNFRDVTLRKSLEWGPVKTNDQGHRSIRYKYEALILDQEQKIINQIFTFDVKGHYLEHETLETIPQERNKQDTITKKSIQFLIQFLEEKFITVHQDGGPNWQKARAITKNTWFVGNFAERNDERWYKLNVSEDVTYGFFMDDESGSGKYTADPVFELFEQKVDESTRMISERRYGYYGMPLEYRPKGSYTVYIRIISDNPGNTSFALGFTELPGVVSDFAKSVRFLFKDNNLDYQSISTPTKFFNKDFKLPFLGLAKDDTYLYIKLVYDSPIKSWVGVRWAGSEPDVRKFLTYGTEIGKNLLIIQLETRKVATYPTHICVEIGDSHSVVIEKDVLDDFIAE